MSAGTYWRPAQVIHPSFAEGTWNAGLLSTEAGTLGRFTGNLLLSVSGKFTGLQTPSQVLTFDFKSSPCAPVESNVRFVLHSCLQTSRWSGCACASEIHVHFCST